MSAKKSGTWRELDEVTGLIELLINYHPQGFSVLLGEVPPPNAEQIHEMINMLRDREKSEVRPSSPSLTVQAERIVWDLEKFEAIVKTAQGWPHINKISREYKDADARTWAVVIDHMKFVDLSASRHMSKLGYVAVRYGLSPNTVLKYRREFAEKLARAILLPPADCDNFHLIPGC